MPELLTVNWSSMFVPSVPIPETIIRGVCTYFALFLMLRVFRRQTGSVGAADLLVLLLVADAAQNAMANNYSSITDGLLLVGTIVFCDYLLDWISFRVPWIGKMIERDPLLVVENGKFQDANLSQELMTRDELMSQLRQKGIDDVSKVEKSYVEGDGRISAILRTPPDQQNQSPPPSSVSG